MSMQCPEERIQSLLLASNTIMLRMLKVDDDAERCPFKFGAWNHKQEVLFSRHAPLAGTTRNRQ